MIARIYLAILLWRANFAIRWNCVTAFYIDTLRGK